MIRLSKNVDINTVKFVNVCFNNGRRSYTYFVPKNETIKVGDYATVLTPRGTVELVEVLGLIDLKDINKDMVKGITFKPLHQILVPYNIEIKEGKQ